MSVSSKFALLSSGGGAALGWSWLFGTGGNNQETRITSVGVDSSDNVYFCGYTSADGSGSFDILIGKYDSSGTEQWLKVLGGASNDYEPTMFVRSNGELYIAYSSAANSGAPRHVKFDSSGTLSWEFYRDPTYWGQAYDIHMDGSVVYLATFDKSFNPDYGGYFRFDASNGGNASSKLHAANNVTYYSYEQSIAGMGSNTCITVGSHATSSVVNSHITKWDTSTGTVIKNLNWGGSSAYNTFVKVVYDTNGGYYFYVVGNGPSSDPVLVLFSTPSVTSTTITLESGLRYGSTNVDQFNGCCLGNSTIGMYGTYAGTRLRWNTATRSGTTLSDSGTPMQIQASSGNMYTSKNNMAIDSQGNIILGFWSPSGGVGSENRGGLIKLPADNSYTGSIQSAFTVSSLSSWSPSSTGLSFSTDYSAIRYPNSNTTTYSQQTDSAASMTTSYEAF